MCARGLVSKSSYYALKQLERKGITRNSVEKPNWGCRESIVVALVQLWRKMDKLSQWGDYIWFKLSAHYIVTNVLLTIAGRKLVVSGQAKCRTWPSLPTVWGSWAIKVPVSSKVIPSHFLKRWWYTIGDFPGLINWVGLVSGACQGIKHVRNIRRVIFFFYFWLAGGWCCAWLLGGVCVTRQHNMAFCPMIKTLVDTLVCICGTFSNCPVSIFILCSYMFDSSCDAKLWSQGHLLYVSALLDSAAHMSVNNKHVC